MLIELVKDVLVRTEEAFVTVKAGTKVNYSAQKREPGHMVHKFTVLHKGRMIEFLCVTFLNDRPEWL